MAIHQQTLNILTGLQQSVQADFPKLFTLRCNTPIDDTLARQTQGLVFTLQLYCEAPVYQHRLPEAGAIFEFTRPPAWISQVAPIIRQGIKVLKFAGHVLQPIVGLAMGTAVKEFEHQLSLTEKIIETLPDCKEQINASVSIKDEDAFWLPGGGPKNDAESIRLLKELFDELKAKNKDKEINYGLYKLMTTEGYVRWVCKEQYDYYQQNKDFKKDV